MVCARDHAVARRLTDSRGQVLVIVAVFVLMLLAMVGLAADGGMFLARRRSVQTAADAAAMGGAVAAWRNPTQTAVAALAGATLNGFTDGTDGVSVTVNNPPLSGYYTGNPKFVEAIVKQENQPTLFLGALGINTWQVKARAVAGPAAPLCLETLNTSGPGVTILGSGSLDAPGCDVVVGSASSNAFNTSSNPLHAGSIGTVATGVTCAGCVPTPQEGILSPIDPLLGLAAPSPGIPASPVTIPPSPTTLNPGTYSSITITSGTVTFNPGTYMLSGRLTILSSTNPTIVNGDGVTFYFYNTAGAVCLNNSINLTGSQTTANLSAPTAGPLAGILFFQDRNIPSGGTCANSLLSGAVLNLTGVIYFPHNALTFAGGSTGAGKCTQLVVGSVSFTGPSALSNDCSNFLNAGGGLISSVALAE